MSHYSKGIPDHEPKKEKEINPDKIYEEGIERKADKQVEKQEEKSLEGCLI